MNHGQEPDGSTPDPGPRAPLVGDARPAVAAQDPARVHRVHLARSPLVRALWVLLGFLCLALAGLGVVLPGLPTTPFLVLAAACFARSSQRLYDWLLARPTLGPMVAAYREGRGIPRKARRWALGLMAAFSAFALGPGMPLEWLWPRIAVLALTVTGVLFLASRPTY